MYCMMGGCKIQCFSIFSFTYLWICTHTHTHTQTGNETCVERLMKQITSFMSEISDEFKTIVVEAIQSVCIKFPRKHHILMTFLSSMLREEGGMEYKKAIVNTIITIIDENLEAKEAGQSCDCHVIMYYSHVILFAG